MKIKSKKTISPDSNFFDIKMENNHNFVLKNGMIAHNCGTGVGFSVERQYVEKLPTIAEQFTNSDTVIVVKDSKEGWAKAYRELISLLIGGQVPRWDVSKIRPAGARLKTFGGRASGPRPLEELFRFTVDTFRRAAGRKLTSIECHDIVCKIAEIVVVGGVRRSALISLSNLTDERMREAKTGQWWLENPQRALANNSVAYKEKPDIGVFMEEWLSLYKSKSGERGIFNRQAAQKTVAKLGERRDPSYEFGTNPCCLPGDTRITTRNGTVPISQIVASPADHEILCYNHENGELEFSPVLAGSLTRPNAEVVALRAQRIHGTSPWEDGAHTTLHLTPDHKVWTANRGYVEAQHLQPTDGLGLLLGDSPSIVESFAQVEPLPQRIDTYDIQTTHENFFANGVLVHNSEIILRDKEFCNLSEVVVRSDDTPESLRRKVQLATILGTWQASLTHFPYLSSEWKKNCEEEALLGVSLTGILDNPLMRKQGKELTALLESLKAHAVETNKEWAKKIGINPAAAITCIKPSGCGTLDTKIKTTEGIMSFDEIFELCGKDPIQLQDGDWVTPPVDIFVFDHNNNTKKITNLYVKGYSPVFQIVDEHGNCYKVSSEHRLLTKSGWKHARELTTDDEIVSFGETTMAKIRSITKLAPEFMVDIEVEDTHSYQLSNGWVSHNTVSQLTDTASGIHARHNEYYIRTVRADRKDPLCQFMIDRGVPAEPCVMRPDHTMVFSFPMKAVGSVTRNDMTAIEHLELWLTYQRHWAEHKPSITVTVREEEWMEVGAWIYKHFDEVSGVSFLPMDLGTYRQAPYQDCTKEEYEKLLSAMPQEIDWLELQKYEITDNTTGTQTFSCTSGSCEIVDLSTETSQFPTQR